jgi:hypothetical protein
MSWWKRLLLWLAGQAPAIVGTIKPPKPPTPPPPAAPTV